MSHEESTHECQELLQGLADHLDGKTRSRMCQELRRHMEGCPNCRLVVNTAERTVQLFRGEEPIELSQDFQERLHLSLKDAWARKFAK
jgi:hypothetical protein